MEKIYILLSSLLAMGCTITSGYHSGPNGRPVHYIDGISAGATYKKASTLCPHGYVVLGEPKQISLVDYVMTIECKPAHLPEDRSIPAAALVPQNTAPPKIGKQKYSAGQAASAVGCATPELASSQYGVEFYRVGCSDGSRMVRCEWQQCVVVD